MSRISAGLRQVFASSAVLQHKNVVYWLILFGIRDLLLSGPEAQLSRIQDNALTRYSAFLQLALLSAEGLPCGALCQSLRVCSGSIDRVYPGSKKRVSLDTLRTYAVSVA
ncbi:hypothetical protein [Methanosarcina siciliae]|uniref:hypothetical protein n=1 Tax=Methanosarcina siciliae TaxID=38027 RepID=UPI0012E05360|nr:hypothetical protein [Methanosarcina siciliae]